MNFNRIVQALVALACVALSGVASSADVKEVRLDYAMWSPTSLVVRKMGWMEDEFKKDNIAVKWVLSQSSANAIDFLKKGSVDFGSSAGLAAVLARANGTSIRSVYIFSKPDWTSLVVRKDSPISAVAELKGKKIAAAPGTDPYIFMVRALELHGLQKGDVEIVPLNHVLGAKALENKGVDAWAGLDPTMTAAVLDGKAKYLYRNPDFCSYGVVNVTDAFAAAHPDIIRRVIKVYEKGRHWIIANPDQGAKLMAEESGLSLEVAKVQLQHNDFSNSSLGSVQIKDWKKGVPVMVSEGLVPSESAASKALDDLVDGSFTKGLK